MNDLIDRQDAIEVADAIWSVTGDKNVAKVWDQIKDLPSAEPERKKGNEKCSNELPCGWCSLFDTPCFGRGGEQDE